ncbi:3,4-dihydroxy-2-butanone-4-phosphate synthase [Haemophilus influenzae HK1212]|uniref:3,4-dihydroxy-2-butanone 4-phosphate synthase n=1 Tax=Haemophilus influenzae HK1212 TaxID=456482 RepID=A0A7G2JXU5_HAEIF|nr:3,4-dihydroxy-2-butanone-4-phosphate synthase [Haemophilus influenzae HK1212]
MVEHNNSVNKTAFTVTIEAAKGVSTGVSAADRVTTIQTAIADNAVPTDLHRPGHVFPLRAANGGVLTRRGHTEASVDLARLAGFKEAGVICEITNDDGTMARTPDIVEFAKKFSSWGSSLKVTLITVGKGFISPSRLIVCLSKPKTFA